MISLDCPTLIVIDVGCKVIADGAVCPCVTVTIQVALLPLLNCAVIVVVPTANAVITPFLSTFATLVLLEVQDNVMFSVCGLMVAVSWYF